MRKLLILLIISLSILVLSLLSCTQTVVVDDPTPLAPPSFSPADGETNVHLSVTIYVGFLESMDISSVIEASTLTNLISGEELTWTLTWDEPLRQGAYYPDEPLEPYTEYEIRIDQKARAADGSITDTDFVATFITMAPWPEVISSSPEDGAVNVPADAVATITFSTAAMDPISTPGLLEVTPETGFQAQVERELMTITFDEELVLDTEYTITLPTDAHDVYDHPLAVPFSFSFTTTDGIDDITSPEVLSYSPASGATDVTQDVGELTITFTEPIDPTSFTLQALDYRLLACDMSEPIWELENTVLRYDLSGLPTGIKLLIDLAPFDDLAGNTSDDPPPWRFTVVNPSVLLPHSSGDWWNYRLTGNAPIVEDYVEKAENVTSYMWDLTRYAPPIGLRAWDIDDYTLAFYRREMGVILNITSWRRFNDDPDGGDDISFTNMIWILDQPLDGGKTWSGTTTFSQGGSDYAVVYNMEVMAELDVIPDYLPPEIDLPETPQLVFPDCFLIRADYEYTYYGTATITETRVDSTWYCPSVGVVRIHEWRTPYVGGNPDDTTETRHDLLRWWTIP